MHGSKTAQAREKFQVASLKEERDRVTAQVRKKFQVAGLKEERDSVLRKLPDKEYCSATEKS